MSIESVRAHNAALRAEGRLPGAINQNKDLHMIVSQPTSKTTKVVWAYGVTTHPGRRHTLLPRTLESLRRSGFTAPHLFVDGDDDGRSWREQFGLDVTCRGSSPVQAFAHWMLSFGELYARHPNATHFAMFQDDFVTCLNLKLYLSHAQFPEKSYLNLYTFPSNTFENLRKVNKPSPQDGYIGFYRSNQRGRGAVGLVFRRRAIIDMFSNKHIVERPLDMHRGHKSIDGGINTSLLKEGYVEYVHNPSLLFHTGTVSSIGNREHPQGVGFPGEDFDAMRFLEGR